MWQDTNVSEGHAVSIFRVNLETIVDVVPTYLTLLRKHRRLWVFGIRILRIFGPNGLHNEELHHISLA
jgi:hypothetical protein